MLFLAKTFMMCVNVFLYNQKRNFSWNRQKMRTFPIDPHYKNRPICNVMSIVTKVGDFYNGGLWGKSLSFVGSSWNSVSGCRKNVDTHYESFSSKKQVIKKLSPKSLWQTYMKWTVVIHLRCCCMMSVFSWYCGSVNLK